MIWLDGLPSGETGDLQHNGVHLQNLHNVIARARASRVEVYCIGIQTPEPAQFYAKDPTKAIATNNDPYFSMVNDINDLPPRLMKQLEAVLFNK
jgi:hypothetical protein